MKIFGHEWEDIERAQQGGSIEKSLSKSTNFKIGDILDWKDLNLQHPSDRMEVVSLHPLRVKWLQTGSVGEIMERDVQLYKSK